MNWSVSGVESSVNRKCRKSIKGHERAHMADKQECVKKCPGSMKISDHEDRIVMEACRGSWQPAQHGVLTKLHAPTLSCEEASECLKQIVLTSRKHKKS